MNRYRSYSLVLILLLIFSTNTSAFAEVTSLQMNSDSFYKGDKIKISGTVEDGTKGLVSIVIRDFEDKFVMLIQTLINHDYSFEKTIKIGDKFSKHGIYNATGFMLNMTKGITTNFGVSLNGISIILNELPIENTVEEIPVEEVIEEIPVEEVIEVVGTKDTVANFVDPSKDPQHYIDRYNNESIYRDWFDKNYPELTIEEAVGHTNTKIETTIENLMDNKIIPEAEASPIVIPVQQSNDNPIMVEMILALVGLVALFGAVYGVKRKVDDNSKSISINRETIRKKFIQPIIGSNPKDILQTRLAKGEITLEEYDKIRSKLY